jgi:hypothetical protein
MHQSKRQPGLGAARSTLLALLAGNALIGGCIPSTAANATCAHLPPPAPDRIGRAQVFNSRIPDKTVLIGRRDIEWNNDGPRLEGVYSMHYMAADREKDKTKTAEWYQNNQPDWIVYKCDGQTIANSYRYPYGYATPVDITNPAVRNHLYEENVRPVLGTNRFDAISVDNLSDENKWGRCGVIRSGVFQREFAGSDIDLSFNRAQHDWLEWLRAKVNADGLCLAGNAYFSGQNPAGFELVADALDIVVEEHGVTRRAKPMELGRAWQTRFGLYRRVATNKPLLIIDYVAQTRDEVTIPAISWSIANYLLVKEDRTYLAMTPMNAPSEFEDFDQLYLQTGRALGPPQTDGRIWWRRFEHAIAVVNPSALFSGRLSLGDNDWRDFEGRVSHGSVEVPPASALVLAPAMAPEPRAP